MRESYPRTESEEDENYIERRGDNPCALRGDLGPAGPQRVAGQFYERQNPMGSLWRGRNSWRDLLIVRGESPAKPLTLRHPPLRHPPLSHPVE